MKNTRYSHSGTTGKKAYTDGTVTIYIKIGDKIPEGFHAGMKPRKPETNIIANNKRKQTCLERYGEENVNRVKSVRDKITKTCLDKYGVEYTTQIDSVKEKMKQTHIKKYGGVGMASPIVSQKIKNTNIDKYGVEYYFQTNEFVEYNKQNQIDKYGGVGFASEELRNKSIQTAMTKYNLSSIEEYNKFLGIRTQSAMIKKYGVNCYAKLPEFAHKARKLYLYNNEYFDSLPELALWIYATDNNESISRPDISFTYNYNGEEHKYLPDFNYNNKLIEIKGDHFFKEDGTMCNPFDHSQDGLYEAKHLCGLKNKVYFWTSKDYNKYIKYCADKYGKWDWYIQFLVKGGDNNEENG